MRERLETIIAELEALHTQALGFNKATYSQGRANPGIANQLQVQIMALKELLDELPETVHETMLQTSDENGALVTVPVAKVVKPNAAKRG